MAFEFSDLNPVQQLALAYARHDTKAAFALILCLDSRLSDVVLKASEPLIAQMKLAWWHDAITAPTDKRPKGEPLLAVLNEAQQSDVAHDIPTALDFLVDAWRVLAANEIWSSDVLDKFAALRSEAVFSSLARWTGTNMPTLMIGGAQWALADLAAKTGEDDVAAISVLYLPRALRPLSILHLAAMREHAHSGKGSGPRLVWHALTGR